MQPVTPSAWPKPANDNRRPLSLPTPANDNRPLPTRGLPKGAAWRFAKVLPWIGAAIAAYEAYEWWNDLGSNKMYWTPPGGSWSRCPTPDWATLSCALLGGPTTPTHWDWHTSGVAVQTCATGLLGVCAQGAAVYNNPINDPTGFPATTRQVAYSVQVGAQWRLLARFLYTGSFPHPNWPRYQPAYFPTPAPAPAPWYYPAVDPFVLPINEPVPVPRPVPYPAIPHVPVADPWRDPLEQPRTDPGSRPRPRARPGHLPSQVPVVVLSQRPGQAPRVGPGYHRRLPPGRGRKEKKVGGVPRLVAAAIGGVSEGFDLIDALYDALPWWVTRGVRGSAMNPRHPPCQTPQCKAAALYDHWNDINMEQALVNMAGEGAKDRYWGEWGNHNRDASRNLFPGYKRGVLTGPLH